MARRAFAYGVLGWVIPGIAALPLAGTHESAGGEALLLAGGVWLLLLGPLGCAIAGWGASWVGARDIAFLSGLGGVAIAVFVVVAVDDSVSVLTIGGAAVVLVLPLVIGYGVGFSIGAIAGRTRRSASSTPGVPGGRPER